MIFFCHQTWNIPVKWRLIGGPVKLAAWYHFCVLSCPHYRLNEFPVLVVLAQLWMDSERLCLPTFRCYGAKWPGIAVIACRRYRLTLWQWTRTCLNLCYQPSLPFKDGGLVTCLCDRAHPICCGEWVSPVVGGRQLHFAGPRQVHAITTLVSRKVWR